MMLSISASLLLAATPPTTISSLFPVKARARSVTSTAVAKAVSWTEKQTSSKGSPGVDQPLRGGEESRERDVVPLYGVGELEIAMGPGGRLLDTPPAGRSVADVPAELVEELPEGEVERLAQHAPHPRGIRDDHGVTSGDEQNEG